MISGRTFNSSRTHRALTPLRKGGRAMMKTDGKKDFLPKMSLFPEGEEKRPEAEKDPAIVIRPA